jgi:hypothetical protein
VLAQNLSGSAMSVPDLLEGHPFFPEWLANRDDFQNQFAEWEEGKVAQDHKNRYDCEIDLTKC